MTNYLLTLSSSALLAVFSWFFTLPLMTSFQGPTYDSPMTKQIIERMVEAHGGLDKWRSAPSLSYHHVMIDPSSPDDPWVSTEVTEQGSRRSYQDWPVDRPGSLTTARRSGRWAGKEITPPS